MMISEEHNQVPNVAARGSSIRFVESLADAQDYWMSLTDAARVTRTSEAMARRWVSSGRLPVKQEPVGVNQRTRLVRASDVARLRPIVDPTAAITDEIHKLDLLSIPRQHIQLAQEHGRLLELVQRVQHTVEHLTEETHTALEQEATHLHEQDQRWELQLAAQRTELQQALDLQRQQHEALALVVRDQAQHIEQSRSELTTQIAHHQRDFEELHAILVDQLGEVRQQVERLDQEHRVREEQITRECTALLQEQAMRFQRLEKVLSQSDQAWKQVQQDLVAIQQVFSANQEAFVAKLERQLREVTVSFTRQWEEQAREKAELEEYVKHLEKGLEHLRAEAKTTARAEQEEAQSLHQQLQMLSVMLHNEVNARKDLEERLASQEPLREA